MTVSYYGFCHRTEAMAFVAGITLVNDSAISTSEPAIMTDEEARTAVAGIDNDARRFQWCVKVVDMDGREDELGMECLT